MTPTGGHGDAPAPADGEGGGPAAAASGADEVEESTKNKRILCLFDVDGTLTIPRKKASPETIEYVSQLSLL